MFVVISCEHGCSVESADFVSVCRYGLCCVCAGGRLWAITGTLDPVRNLTGLTSLGLFSNSIGGTFVLKADGIVAVVVVLAC